MTSALVAFFILLPAFFFYSPSIEQNRVVTIQKTMVITQERKTPAYYLYQQVQNNEAPKAATPVITTYLSTQSYIPKEPKLAVNEMKVDRREIASDVDAGFRTYENQPAIAPIAMNETLSLPNSQPANLQQSPANRWATVRGKFELKDGVGVVDHFIEIKRVEEGRVREVGRIDLNAGTYSIDIESPQGYLEAVITDRNGIRIGDAQQKIVNLQSRGGYFEGPFIRVGNPSTVSVNPVLPASQPSFAYDDKKRNVLAQNRNPRNAPNFETALFSNQHTLEKPTAQFTNISRHSSTLSRIVDSNLIYKTILTIRQSSDQNETPVFTNKWIQGVLEYISDQQKIEFKSTKAPILMGRVFVNAKTIAGAQLQIENHPGISPIYFDQFMIPNFKQNETSENGYFMFVGLEEDNYNVAAFKDGKMIGYQMFATDVDTISYQNIVSTPTARSAIVRTFDAFDGDPLDAELIVPDIEEVIQSTAGTATYRTLNNLGVAQFMARVNQSDYVPVRYFQDARKDFAHIPLVKESWLKKMHQSKLINDMPNTGIIVGFVPDLNYEIFLAKEDYTKDQIMYFDQIGNVVAQPVPGGGFVLFNVPVGTNEVIVQEKNSDKIYSQVFDVKINQVSASHFAE